MYIDAEESNIIGRGNDLHLYLDVLFWGILGGSILSFLGIYLARIGANSFQLSILSAGPAVINMLFSLPAGKWLEGKSFIKVSFQTSLLHRIGYGLILVVMFLFAEYLQIVWIIVVTVIMSIPGALLMIAFNAMFADIISPERRGMVVGRRNAILAVSMTTTAIGCGQLLEIIPFPINYRIVFGIGILAPRKINTLKTVKAVVNTGQRCVKVSVFPLNAALNVIYKRIGMVFAAVFGDGCIIVRKVPFILRRQDAIVTLPVQADTGSDPVGNSVARGIFASHDRRT